MCHWRLVRQRSSVISNLETLPFRLLKNHQMLFGNSSLVFT